MRLALVHHHLRPGGVTRVLEQTVAALDAAAPGGYGIAVLTGEPPPPGSPLAPRHRIVEGLAYREACEAEDPAVLAASLAGAATRALGGPPDVWLIHNPLLGKNAALPGAIRRLAEEGGRLLLHLHDFAEDGRPENYRQLRAAPGVAARGLYPSAGQIHYAVLTPRDAAILTRAGLPPERLRILPNPVAPLPLDPGSRRPSFAEGRRFFLYPTRGIRRKNLGELLLLSLLTRRTHAWATSLSPAHPRWRAGHARWTDLARRLALPVVLGLADAPEFSFGGLVSSADGMVTTSVSEGFGLAFLEPWLCGKAVRGRRLPEITRHFEGVDLPGMYDRLAVPVRWIDSNRLHEKLDLALRASHRAYGRDLPDDAIERAYMAAVRSGGVDFGRLDEELQETVLERLHGGTAGVDDIEPPDLDPAPSGDLGPRAALISARYGPAACAARLAAACEALAAAAPTEVSQLDGEAVLDAFLDAGRFHLLCQ